MKKGKCPELSLQFQGVWVHWSLHMDDLGRWSLTSQVPGIGFMENNFSTDRVVVVGMVWDDLSALHLLWTLFLI